MLVGGISNGRECAFCIAPSVASQTDTPLGLLTPHPQVTWPIQVVCQLQHDKDGSRSLFPEATVIIVSQ